ncbi:hypothetical protein DPEC_G00300020 [Dallia pectoralis]|uniref:Uncharacterized protein n=1 Tax=Dallia pectoralis TaxID=75939 RepID=A0ACC2FGA1_DALPE|nr:hypothetical protein DPEC_G00300020 [Dallia pectoralis]
MQDCLLISRDTRVYLSGNCNCGPGMSRSLSVSETVPLLIPDPETQAWRPMSKQELRLAAGGRGWRSVRLVLVVVFWLCWLGMLAAAVTIIVRSPRPAAPPLLWWQGALFYRIQPSVFMDAQTQVPAGVDAVCERLPYLKSLGVGAVILEELFRRDASPTNLTSIDRRVGILPQVHKLFVESHKEGIKLVLSLCNLDLFGHQHSVGNNSNGTSELFGSIQNALQFWLDQGVSGFEICDTDAAYSTKILTEWRALFKVFSTPDDERIIMVKQTGESLSPLNTFGPSTNQSLVEMVTRSLLPHARHPLSSQEVAVAMERHLSTPPGHIWPSWTVGGEATPVLHRILLVLMMTLPGSPVVKYGEETVPSSNVSAQIWEGEPVTTPGQGNSIGEPKINPSASALFRSLSHSRLREESLLYGTFTFLPFNTTSSNPANGTLGPESDSVLAFLRSWGCVHFLVLLNLGPETRVLDPAWAPWLPTEGVFVASTGLDRLGATSLETLRLQPEEAVVIKLFESGSYSP